MMDCEQEREKASRFCAVHQLPPSECSLGGCARQSEVASRFCIRHQLPGNSADAATTGESATPRTPGLCGLPGCGLEAEAASLFCLIHQPPAEKDPSARSEFNCAFTPCDQRAKLGARYCDDHQLSEELWALYRQGHNLA